MFLYMHNNKFYWSIDSITIDERVKTHKIKIWTVWSKFYRLPKWILTDNWGWVRWRKCAIKVSHLRIDTPIVSWTHAQRFCWIQNGSVKSWKTAFRFGRWLSQHQKKKIGKTDKECSICLKNFTKGEVIRLLKCKHLFHDECIVPWFESRSCCPNCRADVKEEVWLCIFNRFNFFISKKQMWKSEKIIINFERILTNHLFLDFETWDA